MGRRKKIEPDNKEQSAQFVETAKKIQAADAKERFEDTCDIILKKKKQSSILK